MSVFIIRRLLQSLLVVWVMSVVVFFGVNVVGDPVDLLISHFNYFISICLMMIGLHAMMAKMNLVTREEFEIQQAVLLRTREKLRTLEARVAALEAAAKD